MSIARSSYFNILDAQLLIQHGKPLFKQVIKTRLGFARQMKAPTPALGSKTKACGGMAGTRLSNSSGCVAAEYLYFWYIKLH